MVKPPLSSVGNMICVLAYYYFTPVASPEEEVARHFAFFEGLDARGRIYLSTEGINGQMSASPEVAESYMQWLRADPRFASIEFKIQWYPQHAFPRLTVKVRRQLVAVDVPFDLALTGERVSPEQWRQMLEERDQDTLLLDVRNDYEWKVGHFEGASLPALTQFREFPSYAKKLREERDPQTTRVMMYCTGGIRCEVYSALLKQEGFTQVFQLDGGIVNYGLQEGSTHWKGKLFVFDDRLAVPIAEEGSMEPISSCSHCTEKSDVYYNCANMDCNELFLCCPDCAASFSGCCSEKCQGAPRLRSYDKAERPKPFRRMTKGSACSL